MRRAWNNIAYYGILGPLLVLSVGLAAVVAFLVVAWIVLVAWKVALVLLACAAAVGLWVLMGVVGEAAGFGGPRHPYDN